MRLVQRIQIARPEGVTEVWQLDPMHQSHQESWFEMYSMLYAILSCIKGGTFSYKDSGEVECFLVSCSSVNQFVCINSGYKHKNKVVNLKTP